MDKFEKYNDLADLLDDNSIRKRDTKSIPNRRGDFLTTLQRSKSFVSPDNKNMYSTYSSDELNNEEHTNAKKGIEIDSNIDTFEMPTEQRKNNIPILSENNNNPETNFYKKGRSTTEKVIDRSKIDEQLNLNNLLGRRRSQLISNKDDTNNLNNEKIRDEGVYGLEMKSESWNTFQKIEEEESSDSYIPILTKNSRRVRGSIMKQIEEKDSRDNSLRKDESFETLKDRSSSVAEKKENSITPINQQQISAPVIKKLQIEKITNNSQQDIDVTPDKNIRTGIRFNESPTNIFKFSNSIGEANLSFRGEADNANLKESIGYFETLNKSPNKQEIQNLQEINYRMNADKDYLQTQLNILKQRSEEDRSRYERQIEDERQNSKRKENEYKNFLEELNRRHKDESMSSETRNKSAINSLNEDIRRIRADFVNEIQSERERMAMFHQSDLENKENLLNKNFEIKKHVYEDQIETLKRQLNKQIEVNKIASKVENSSHQIDDIVQKFYREKETSLENEKSHLKIKEKFFMEKEEKIKENENSIKLEKEKINQMLKDFEYRDIEKRRESQEEKQRIEKEITKLEELQNTLKSIEFNSKEKYEREKLEFIQKHSEMKKEHDDLKRDFFQRMKELENDKKILEEEKRFFEKYKDESTKMSEIKIISIEERKNKFSEEEKETKARIKTLQEKQYFLKEKFEEFEEVRKEIADNQNKLEKDRSELITAARRIEEGLNLLGENKRQFEMEKGEYLRKFQECENERSIVQKEKIKIEQAKAELRLRIQSVDMMRMQYVSGNLSTDSQMGMNFNSNSDLKSASVINFNKTATKLNEQSLRYSKNNFSPSNAGLISDSNYFSQTKSSLSKTFNADEYMQNLKMKMKLSENANRSFSKNNKEENYGKIDCIDDDRCNNINNYVLNEKEYLKKSNEDFLRKFNKEAERSPQADNFRRFNMNFSDARDKVEEANRDKENEYDVMKLDNRLIDASGNKHAFGEYITSSKENNQKNSSKINDITDESIIMNNQYMRENIQTQNNLMKKVNSNVLNEFDEKRHTFDRFEPAAEKNKMVEYDDDEIAELDDF